MNISYYLDEYWRDIQYPLTKSLFLVNVSPVIIISLMCGFCIIFKYIIPSLMKNREPFQLRKIMFIYNCIMVFINGCGFFLCITMIDLTKLWDFKYPSRDISSKHAYQLIYWGINYIY